MSFYSRFKDNAHIGWASFKKPATWWVRIALIMTIPLALLFWATFAMLDKDDSL